MSKPAWTKRGSYAQYIKSVAKAMGRDVLPEIKLPRAQRSDKGKRRGPSQQPERELRNEVIKYLRRDGCKVWRIENAVWGRHNIGLPDLFIHCPATNWTGFCELKATTDLRPEQLAFKEVCLKGGIQHIVCRCIKDLEEVFSA